MQLKVKLALAITAERSVKIDIENDLGFSEAEWQHMTKEQQEAEIDEYVGGFDPVYWDVQSYEAVTD